MTSTVTVRLPARMRAHLRRIGEAEHVPISDLVREALRSHLAIREFRRLRSQTLPFAEAQGLLTDEDIFKAIS